MVRLGILGALLTAASLIACSAQDRGFANADAADCSVYTAFYEQLNDNSGIFVRSTTLPLPPIAGGEFDREAVSGRELEYLEGRRDSIIQSLREEVSIDSSGYFAELDAAPMSVASCFGPNGPPIHDGTLNEARLREALLSVGRRSNPTLVTVSSVAFSPDNRHAMIYVTHECGGLCGGGAFYVFERREAWTRIKITDVWVS